ncbi:hypothetical protein Tco_0916701 [Tanacetum coccineum]
MCVLAHINVLKGCETCGSIVHTTSDHNDIEWFRRDECDIRKPIWYLDSGCSRQMTGVKSYLHKYVEQPGPKVVFGDDSTCVTEGYGSIKCNGIFDEKRGTIFNSNKEIVMIAPRVRDVYVLDMTSSEQEYCLPSLVYSKDKPCSSCEKGRHHRASFKTKQTFSIKKSLHLFHMDLFRPVTPRSNNHEKYTLVIVDKCSSYKHKGYLGKFDEKADDETEAPSDQNDQSDQNDHPSQENDIPNDNPPKHSNHNNDSPIIENLINVEVVQDSEPTSSPVEDASAQNTIPIPNIPSSSIPSTISLVP